MADNPDPSDKPWQVRAPLPAERLIARGRAAPQTDQPTDKPKDQPPSPDSRPGSRPGRPAELEFEPTPLPPAATFGLGRQLDLLLATRRVKLRQFGWRAALFILLPTFIVWFYTAVIATPAYVCNYEITYQSYQPSATLGAGLTQTTFGSNSSDSIDYGTLLCQYISSSQLAEQIDQQMDLRYYYSRRRIDWFSRLNRHASQAEFLSYWQSNVVASEGFGGYITVSVKGYDPQFTLALAQNIYKAANQMMDRLTAEADAAEVDAATRQLLRANTALQDANEKLTDFRNAHGDFDPSYLATDLDTIIGSLESQLANLRAQMVQAQANLQPNSSQIVQLKLQISGLESQISTERQRLAAQNDSTSYSNLVTQYQALLSNQTLATTNQQAAQQGLIVAQADSDQKQNYVVDFVPPYVPEQPTEPRPLVAMFTTLLACICIYGIGNLLFSAFRDQAGI